MGNTKIPVLAVLIIGVAVFTACAPADPTTSYCEQHGGRYESRHVNNGAVGYCVFPDNTECPSWDFYQGTCKPGQTPSRTRYDMMPTQMPQSRADHSADAAVPPPKTLEELAGKADLVFVGEVGSVVQRRTYSGYGPKGELLDGFDVNGTPVPTAPITDFELKVEQVVKDDGAIASGKPIILRMGGDATPEMKRLTASGEYPFSFTGDRHLFLLTRNPDGQTYGFYYGPWSRLVIDENNNLRISNGSQELPKLDGSNAAISLDEFVRRVKHIS